ncbi:2Fe-2S iron-sulfur cluster-binding protein [Streptomyces sp. Je 1-79]|uniref:2Fe-2S iron-sulfur cluster-binding protein n=1 Tax=Streptomyces sp. Je 1-79 TaxID=2943847 RepID=UPI0021A79811|nr:2Fe-2S iron-sulfur cluster-binding protein [Streptomyces sp. Je 1-79]MCT4356013.1 2Fe-2S iron-sulfur cluster-binding protein [Streptomyces sp. Je 1-79]
MSDEPNGNASGGGWEPIPQSEGYDGDATAFVQLPPDFMLDGVPLEAPGHGYVPPMIMPLTPLTPAAGTDPAATGQWVVQPPTAAETTAPEGVGSEAVGPEYMGSEAMGAAYMGSEAMGPEYTGPGATEPAGGADPHATGQWNFADAGQPDPHGTGQWNFAGAGETPEPASTGQWRIPVVADGPDASDESGEYTASMLAQYAGSAPATLPGGAPAPWAVQEPADGDTAAADSETDATESPEGSEGHAEAGAHPEAAEAAGTARTSEYADTPGMSDADAAATAADGPGRAAGEPDPAPSTGNSADSDEHPHISYVLRVNGADRPVTESWIGESLLYVLRERLGLAGAKDGCSQGECGACNVQVDGRLVASCLVPAATAAGSEVRTVEGLATDGEPSDVQRALARCGAVQCGYCVPGMAMTVHDLLEGNHAPTELETRQALCGNLCRCSGYRGVLDAVREVVAERDAQAAATADEARIPHQIPHPHDGGTA